MRDALSTSVEREYEPALPASRPRPGRSSRFAGLPTAGGGQTAERGHTGPPCPPDAPSSVLGPLAAPAPQAPRARKSLPRAGVDATWPHGVHAASPRGMGAWSARWPAASVRGLAALRLPGCQAVQQPDAVGLRIGDEFTVGPLSPGGLGMGETGELRGGQLPEPEDAMLRRASLSLCALTATREPASSGRAPLVVRPSPT